MTCGGGTVPRGKLAVDFAETRVEIENRVLIRSRGFDLFFVYAEIVSEKKKKTETDSRERDANTPSAIIADRRTAKFNKRSETLRDHSENTRGAQY